MVKWLVLEETILYRKIEDPVEKRRVSTNAESQSPINRSSLHKEPYLFYNRETQCARFTAGKHSVASSSVRYGTPITAVKRYQIRENTYNLENSEKYRLPSFFHSGHSPDSDCSDVPLLHLWL